MAAPHPSLLGLVNGKGFPTDTPISMPLVASADEHGVAALLDAAVRDHGIGGERDALVLLAMRSLESAAETAAAEGALIQLVEESTHLGVELAAFKGLAIGRRWYLQPELRPAVDVDIFINPTQADRIGSVVEALTEGGANRRAVDAMVAEGRVFEIPLAVNGVAVDLHIDPMNMVVPMRRLGLLWERTESMPIGGGHTVRVLDLEMSMLQALLHLFRDNFADLLHIYDIARMMDHDPDWDFIAETAENEGWTDIVRESIGFSSDVLGRPPPLPRNLSATNRLLVGAIWPRRIRLEGATSLGRSNRRQSFSSLLIRRRRADVVCALVRRVFPPRSVIEQRYPDARGWYIAALYRWRRSQRAEILRFRAAATGSPTQSGVNTTNSRAEETPRETI